MATLTATRVEIDGIELAHTAVGKREANLGNNDTVDDGNANSGHVLGEGVVPATATQDTAQESEYPMGAKFWLTMLSLAGVLILTSVDMNIVATAVPSITDHFHTVGDVGWYSSAFRLCVCAFQFLFGRAYTLFPVKRVFLLANAVSMAGSLLCGAASSSAMLVAGRAVAGLGSAGIFSGCLVMLVQSVALRRRPLFLGVVGGIEGVATLAAPLLGGVITQGLGWRWCFYINLPFGALTLLLTACCYSDRSPGRESETSSLSFAQKLLRLDLVSNLVLVPALTSLFLALSWAGVKHPWRSVEVVVPLVAFGVLLAVFVLLQIRRGDLAALPPRIMGRRTVLAGALFIMCANSTGNVLEYYLPTYYQTVRGYSPARSGLLMLPIIVGATVGSLVHGAGTSALGHYGPFMLLASVGMPVAAGLATTLGPDASTAKLVAYTALAGLSYGVGFSGPQNAVQAVLPADDVPLGLSVMLFAQSFGPAVAVAVAQVIFTDRLWAKVGVNDTMGGGGGGVTRAQMEKSGLGELVRSVPPEQAWRVVEGIDRSISQTWYLVVGLACATMVGTVLIEWRSVKAKRA